jgi:hypothetical protein
MIKLPPYSLAGFDLTTHSSSLLGGRRRRYHYVGHAARASIYVGMYIGRRIDSVALSTKSSYIVLATQVQGIYPTIAALSMPSAILCMYTISNCVFEHKYPFGAG